MNLIKYIKSKFAKKSYTELAEEILSQSNFDSNIEIIIPADIDDKLITSTNNQIILIGVKEKNNIIIKEIIQKENPIGKLDEVINSENAVAFLFNIAENADTFYTNEQLGELIKLSNNHSNISMGRIIISPITNSKGQTNRHQKTAIIYNTQSFEKTQNFERTKEQINNIEK